MKETIEQYGLKFDAREMQQGSCGHPRLNLCLGMSNRRIQIHRGRTNREKNVEQPMARPYPGGWEGTLPGDLVIYIRNAREYLVRSAGNYNGRSEAISKCWRTGPRVDSPSRCFPRPDCNGRRIAGAASQFRLWKCTRFGEHHEGKHAACIKAHPSSELNGALSAALL